MDEAFLTDLLECSVCLEQLDSTSKVLPCQHTFCKRCLDEIVNSHKELRCPECRVLVDCRVEDLPLNILLIRLLEGIKNNPRLGGGGGRSPGNGAGRQPPFSQAPLPTNANHPSPAGNTTTMGVRTLVKQLAPPLPCAKALYAYEAKDPGDLTFRKGEVIVLRKRIDQNWFHGELGGKQGFVPASYVQVVVPLPSHVPQCKALYDFRLGGGNTTGENDEKDCLAFLKGDVITVIRRVDENWAEGKLSDRIGIFPISFVEMNAAGKALMKLSTNAQVGPSRVAPPTPSAETSGNPPPASTNVPSAGESQSSTASPESSSPSPGTPSSSSPPLPTCRAPREKRHSLSALSSSGAHSPQTPHRHSMEILSNGRADAPSPPRASPSRIPAPSSENSTEVVSSSRAVRRHGGRREHENASVTTQSLQLAPPADGNPTPIGQSQPASTHVPVPTFYLALYNYKPQKEDELELRKNELYTVTEKCQDGWFKGTSLRTGLSGVFPGNYVQPAKTPSGQYHPGGMVASSSLPVSRIPAPVSPRPRSVAPFGTGLPPPLQGVDSFQRPPCGGEWSLAPPPQRPTQRPPNPVGIVSATVGHRPPMQALAAKVPTNVAPSLEVGGASPAAAITAGVGASHMGNQWLLAWPAPNTTAYAASTWAPPSSSCTTPTRSPPQQPQGLQAMPPAVVTCSPSSSGTAPRGDKVGDLRSVLCHQKERKEKDKLSLMKRLTSKRKSRSPPPVANFSCDNPTFVDATSLPPQGGGGGNTTSLAVVHVRSGSCPSEALGNQQASHKKTSSLDGNDTLKARPKQPAPLVRERFRCIVPYPPNSEYELELKQGDVVYVHKKRDDGWYKGTLQRTGKTGLFPGSFVEGF